MNNKSTTTPAIYVGTYHKYNCGSIAGRWIDLDDFIDKQDFLTACTKLHKDEADPELMFQDWEGIPELFIGESYIEDSFWAYMEADGEQAAKAACISCYGSWDADKFEEAFQGEYESELEFTYQLIDDTGMLTDLPEELQRYFDYEAFNRDLFISDYTFLDGYVFRADV